MCAMTVKDDNGDDNGNDRDDQQKNVLRSEKDCMLRSEIHGVWRNKID